MGDAQKVRDGAHGGVALVHARPFLHVQHHVEIDVRILADLLQTLRQALRALHAELIVQFEPVHTEHVLKVILQAERFTAATFCIEFRDQVLVGILRDFRIFLDPCSPVFIQEILQEFLVAVHFQHIVHNFIELRPDTELFALREEALDLLSLSVLDRHGDALRQLAGYLIKLILADIDRGGAGVFLQFGQRLLFRSVRVVLLQQVHIVAHQALEFADGACKLLNFLVF